MDFSDEILNIADALERVTLERFGSDTVYATDGALKRKPRLRDETTINRIVPQSWCHWILPQRDIPSMPRLGDEIVDADGRRWLVHAVDESSVNRLWKCVSYSFEYSFELDDFVDIFKRESVKSAAGTLEHRWVLRLAGVAIKYANETVTAAADNISISDANISGKTTRIVVARNCIDLTPSDRMRFPGGIIYGIVRYHLPKHKNEWIEIELETQDHL